MPASTSSERGPSRPGGRNATLILPVHSGAHYASPPIAPPSRPRHARHLRAGRQHTLSLRPVARRGPCLVAQDLHRLRRLRRLALDRRHRRQSRRPLRGPQCPARPRPRGVARLRRTPSPPTPTASAVRNGARRHSPRPPLAAQPTTHARRLQRPFCRYARFLTRLPAPWSSRLIGAQIRRRPARHLLTCFIRLARFIWD